MRSSIRRRKRNAWRSRMTSHSARSWQSETVSCVVLEFFATYNATISLKCYGMLVTTVVIGNILHFSVVVVLFNGHYMPVFPTKSWVSLRFCIAHMSLMSHGCLVYSAWFILTPVASYLQGKRSERKKDWRKSRLLKARREKLLRPLRPKRLRNLQDEEGSQSEVSTKTVQPVMTQQQMEAKPRQPRFQGPGQREALRIRTRQFWSKVLCSRLLTAWGSSNPSMTSWTRWFATSLLWCATKKAQSKRFCQRAWTGMAHSRRRRPRIS